MQDQQQLEDLLGKTAESYWQRLQQSCAQTPLLEDNENSIKQILALSDFVAEALIRTPTMLETLLNQGLLQQNQVDYQQQLSLALENVSSEEQLQQCLRQFRALHMVRLAWRDLLNMQDIETSLQHVSTLADNLIMQASQWLYQHLCQRYGTPQGEHGPQPLLVIGMGKLGGKELNFSSDIDLIFAFPSSGATSGGRKSVEHQQFFTRLAQKLITALNQVTTDGQVFRVDMRLRPFGESGPLVANFAALEDYYQEQGREWERYAMVKGRILNPQSALKDELQSILKPFVYRRYLDYGAIDSLRKMKQLINQELRRRGLKNNIKLGRGGIREVEFIAQSFQLIRGGREPALRHQSLLTTLKQLEQLDILNLQEYQQLSEGYLFLRKTEHCLQQFADQQTQLLPDDKLNQQRLCQVMGYDNYPAFLACLQQHMQYIHQQFLLLVGGAEEEQEQQDDEELSSCKDLWQLALEPDEQLTLLQQWLNEDKSQQMITHLHTLKHQVAKRHIGQKGQDTIAKLIPRLLLTTLKYPQQEVDKLFQRLVTVLCAILGRTTYLDLLNENQGAADQLVKLCAASPWIAEQMARFPLLLDELLNPVALYQPTPLDQYAAELRETLLRVEPDDLEQQMEVLRQFKLSQQLRIAAADVTAAVPVMKVSDHLTYLAEAILDQVISLSWQQVSVRFGVPIGHDLHNSGFAVLAYGKMGGIELGYGSDLDLVFIHNADNNCVTDGKKSISAQQFYIKLAQRIMHHFNTKTVYGELYEADLRLRPSGNSGLLVCHINGFAQYQLQEAWTWEHQALVRSRFVWGHQQLAKEFSAVRQQVLCQPRQRTELASEVTTMRKKMRDHLTNAEIPGIDLKQDQGGIADIEFLVQYWVLAHAHLHPDLCLCSDNVRILQSLSQAGVITTQQQQRLNNAYLHFRNTNHRLALQQQAKAHATAEIDDFRAEVTAIWQQVFN